MDVTVSSGLCEGNGLCVLIAPDVFDLDDDGIAVTTASPVPAELEADAEEAVAACPRQALEIDGGEL